MVRILILLIGVILVTACQRPASALGDREITIFDNVRVNFDPASKQYGPQPADDGIIHLMDGRIILKKIALPVYERDVKIRADIRLTSAGDRWDKSGSCFVIPGNSDINFLKIKQGLAQFPQVGGRSDSLAGMVPADGFKPVVEIMRFMTPFGVGFYSDTMDTRRPVYVPRWAEDVHWNQEVSQLLSELQGEVWIGVWVDSWTREGYRVSLKLQYDESDYACARIKASHVEPLLNTISYINGQNNINIFFKKEISVAADIPGKARNCRLYYITTGHGGHSGGDEFTRQENVIQLDGRDLYRFTPWRDDCASFRRFNPTSGVWLIPDTVAYINWKKRKREEKTIEVPLASSDLSRSNWCPGSDVPAREIILNETEPGRHTFTFSIPNAQQAVGDKLNHWLVSAYLVWEE